MASALQKASSSMGAIFNEIVFDRNVHRQEANNTGTGNNPVSAQNASTKTINRADSASSHEKLGMHKHAYALFMIVFCSILEGSFISFVIPVHKTLSIQTVLYFVRIFSDLFGRPLTMLKLPTYMRSIDGIITMAYFRVMLLFVFFMYIYLPENLRVAYESDAFILVLQMLISVSSGFLIVLVYNSASTSLVGDKNKSKGVEVLTVTFQGASAIASLVAGFLLFLTGDLN